MEPLSTKTHFSEVLKEAAAPVYSSQTDQKTQECARKIFSPSEVLKASSELLETIKGVKALDSVDDSIACAFAALGILSRNEDQEVRNQAESLMEQIDREAKSKDVIKPTLAKVNKIAGGAISQDERAFFENAQRLWGSRPLSDSEIANFHHLWRDRPELGNQLKELSESLLTARHETLKLLQAGTESVLPLRQLPWNRESEEKLGELVVQCFSNGIKEVAGNARALFEQACLDNLQIHTDSIFLSTYPQADKTYLNEVALERGLYPRSLREGESKETEGLRVIDSYEGRAPFVLRQRMEGSPVYQAEDWSNVTFTKELPFISGTRCIYFSLEQGEPRKAFAHLDIREAKLTSKEEVISYLDFLTELSNQALIENEADFVQTWLDHPKERAELLSGEKGAYFRELIERHLSKLSPKQQEFLLDSSLHFIYNLYLQMTVAKLELG